MVEAFFGIIIGVTPTLFTIIGLRGLVDEARTVECQAKLNVTKCVRVVEYVADAGQK